MGGTVQLTGKYAELAEKALRNITRILEEANIPYTLEGGTLLGIVREGRLLPWDTDMDLTITNSNASRLLALRWKFWLKGYRTRVRYFKQDIGPFKKGEPRILKIQSTRFLFFKDIGLMDIFIKKRVDNQYFWMVGPSNPVIKAVDSAYYEELTTFNFRNKMYYIPVAFDAYLQSRYGDWRTPRQDWDFRKDDLSIK